MFQGSYNTEHGVRILARAIKFDKIEAITKYKYANFTIRKYQFVDFIIFRLTMQNIHTHCLLYTSRCV